MCLTFCVSQGCSSGKVTERIDPNGNVFQTSYDTLGRVLEDSVPDVSLDGAISSKRGGRRLTSHSPPVTKTSYHYMDIGVGSSVRKTDYQDGANSCDTYTYFDGLGRAIQTRKQAETTNEFAVKDSFYNDLGLLQRDSLPYFSTGSAKTPAAAAAALYTFYSYDALHRLKLVTTAIGTTTNTYDDWKLTVTDANGKLKDIFKDAYDHLVRVDEHNGASSYTTSYEYNGLGELTKLTDAEGNLRNFTYDGLGRRRTSEDLHAAADSTFGTWMFDFDDSGNLISRLDPNAQTCEYSYDSLNRVLTEDFAGQAEVEVTYIYDDCVNGVGHLCSVSNGSLTQSNTYNALGLPATEDKTIDSVTYHSAYSYDLQGNQTKILNPDGSLVAYQYNNAGLIEKVLSGPSASADLPVVISNIDYSPLGQIRVIQYSNGAVTTNSYDAAKRYRLQHKLTLLPNENATARGQKSRAMRPKQDDDSIPSKDEKISGINRSNPFEDMKVAQDLTYEYDNVGNVMSIVDASETNTARTTIYSYDDLYRLTSATTSGAPTGMNYEQTYSYDALGNIVMKSDRGNYSYEGSTGDNYANPHAVTQIENGISNIKFQYDRNGNLISTDGLTNHWDYNNRMSQTVLGSTVLTYVYDQNGQRVKYSNGTTTTVYPSRYYNISSAIRGAGSRVRLDNAVKHIFIGDLLVASVKGSSDQVLYAVHTDHLTGSNVISNSGGQVEELTDYFPFGEIRLEENNGNFTEQRRFTGHELDSDTGLTYMDARYYNSSLGRFLNQDAVFLQLGATGTMTALGNPQSLNSYTYANNNPVTNVDLDGNFSLNAFQVSIGNWANNLYDRNSVARAALDHPLAPAIIGAAPLAIYIGGTEGVVNGAVNVGNEFLISKVEGRRVSAEEYGYSFVTGAFDVGLPVRGPLAKAAVAGAENLGQQKLFGEKGVDWGSVFISAGSTAATEKLLSLHPANNQTMNEITKTATNFVIKDSVQIPYSGVRRSQELKKKGN